MHTLISHALHGIIQAVQVNFILRFERSLGDQTIFCAFNLSGEPGVTEMPEGTWRQIGIELGSAGPAPDGKLHLGPWQPALLMKAA